jgi:hypothetical protein
MNGQRPWNRLRPRDLFQHPNRVAIARTDAGFFASDGYLTWNLGYWAANPVADTLCDGRRYRLRTTRADFLEQHDEDLSRHWRTVTGPGLQECFQAKRTPWDGPGFALWAVPHPQYGAFPLPIGDRVSEVLRGQYFRIFTSGPGQRHALITWGFHVVGILRPIRLDWGGDLQKDATLLASRFRTYRPEQWPSWGPV